MNAEGLLSSLPVLRFGRAIIQLGFHLIAFPA
jgi:hypothetical protein